MGINQNFNNAKEKAKQQIKKLGKKLLKKLAPYFCGFILIAGFFFIIEGAIKDAVDNVVSAASKVTSVFDNKSNNPAVVISDDLIKDIEKQMRADGMNVDETYLTDALLKVSLEAYYATQYPYIEGIDYGKEEEGTVSNAVKGAIYLKRENEDMQYVNYDIFTSMMGDGKSTSDKNDIKTKFSVDNEGNIVVATWSMTSTVTETMQEDGTYSKEGTEVSNSYNISEYKIDQKTLTEQYAMSYKFPILLANMYSNEGFGVAVAKLGRNAKIELSILDNISETTTVSKELLKKNYKANGTYKWKDKEDDSLKTEKFDNIEWVNDYTDESNAYRVITEKTETNNLTVKPTKIDTWCVKGNVTDITPNNSSDSYDNETPMTNNDDYNEDTTAASSDVVISKVKNMIKNNQSKDDTKGNSIESIDAKVYKKVTDHKTKTSTVTKQTTYTSSDMQLTDNTDKFLALIKADEKGKYSKNGKLIEYIKKGIKVTNTTSAVSWTSNNTSSTSGGDYIVDTTKSDSSLVINDKKTLKKAFKGYPTNKKLLENIDTFLEMQEKYHVNAVFAAAVAINETTAGTAGHGADSCHNWFNYQPISGMKKGDSRWAAFSNDSEGIMGFGQLIATSPNYYFSKGQNTVSEIGTNYCEGNTWADNVTKFMDDMYKAAGINVKKESSSNSSDTGSSNSAKGDGYSKTYTTNGKTYKEFKQGSGTYYDVHYSGGNISSSGCGPTSAAIVASGYGKNYNPGTLVEAAKKKYHVSNFTASPDATGKMLKTAGLNYTETFSLSKEQFKNHLKSGRPVVMSVDNSCGGLFTNHTHYIAILDINKKGDKVYVANPSSKASGWIDIDKVIKCNSSSQRVAFLITSK